jgi:hypothetical protein
MRERAEGDTVFALTLISSLTNDERFSGIVDYPHEQRLNLERALQGK